MQAIIQNAVDNAIIAANCLNTDIAKRFIEKAAEMIADTYKKSGKVIIAGNGGSLCDSMHFSEELTGFFRSRDRKPLSAIALCEMGLITCIGNDVGFDQVFSRPVLAHANENDIFIAMTTSGNSQNLINAVLAAKEKKAGTISFLGKDGGKMKNLSDLEWIVSGFDTSDRIQEAHMAAVHIIIEIVEHLLFPKKDLLKKDLLKNLSAQAINK